MDQGPAEKLLLFVPEGARILLTMDLDLVKGQDKFSTVIDCGAPAKSLPAVHAAAVVQVVQLEKSVVPVRALSWLPFPLHHLLLVLVCVLLCLRT